MDYKNIKWDARYKPKWWDMQREQDIKLQLIIYNQERTKYVSLQNKKNKKKKKKKKN